MHDNADPDFLTELNFVGGGNHEVADVITWLLRSLELSDKSDSLATRIDFVAVKLIFTSVIDNGHEFTITLCQHKFDASRPRVLTRVLKCPYFGELRAWSDHSLL